MIELRAPAKINLTLEILARRPDGYHTLRSLMVPIGLHDRIVLEPAATPSFTIGTGDATLADDNLVARALAACGVTGSYAVTLDKTIPVGGGLGGGSSDAAQIVAAAMDGRLPTRAPFDAIAVASALGSDVPFFLARTGALVEGVGERVTPIGALPPWWVWIVRPRAAVPTAAAYRMLDDARANAPEASRPRATSLSMAAVDAVQRHDFLALRHVLVNDFHALVLGAYPAVAEAHAAMVAAGASHALLSGSGSCLFAIFTDEAAARASAESCDVGVAESSFVAPLHASDAWRRTDESTRAPS